MHRLQRAITVLLLTLTSIASAPGQAGPASAASAKTDQKSRVVYVNRRYGFRFYLPTSWAGFTILEDSWTPHGGGRIRIRHPLWTDQVPREDIPIMIFTRAQWEDVEQEKLVVSAAPFPPAELGRNKKFVFALPPRWNYDLAEGWEEAGQILTHGLKAFDP